MKRLTAAVWLMAAAASAQGAPPAPGGPSGARGKPARKEAPAKPKAPPFYEKYLGDSLVDQRIREMEKKIATDPRNAGLRNDMGNLLAIRGFAEQALAQYRRASKLDRTFFLADYNAGLLYEKEGERGRAILSYRRSIARKRGFPNSHFHLGYLYELDGRNRDAEREYAKALRIDPTMRDVARNPLVPQTRLLPYVSLSNYPRDLASATLSSDAGFEDESLLQPVPMERPIDTGETEPARGRAGSPVSTQLIGTPPGAGRAPAAPGAREQPAMRRRFPWLRGGQRTPGEPIFAPAPPRPATPPATQTPPSTQSQEPAASTEPPPRR